MVDVNLKRYEGQTPDEMVQIALGETDGRVVGFEVNPDEFFVVLKNDVSAHGHSTDEMISCVFGKVQVRNSLAPASESEPDPRMSPEWCELEPWTGNGASLPYHTPARFIHEFKLATEDGSPAVLHISGPSASMHMKGDSFTPSAQ